MTPHRRRCLTKAILEIKGALTVTDRHGTVSLLSAEKLLLMTNDELFALYEEIGKAFESANITEPMPNLIEKTETILMPAVIEPEKKR